MSAFHPKLPLARGAIEAYRWRIAKGSNVGVKPAFPPEEVDEKLRKMVRIYAIAQLV